MNLPMVACAQSVILWAHAGWWLLFYASLSSLYKGSGFLRIHFNEKSRNPSCFCHVVFALGEGKYKWISSEIICVKAHHGDFRDMRNLRIDHEHAFSFCVQVDTYSVVTLNMFTFGPFRKQADAFPTSNIILSRGDGPGWWHVSSCAQRARDVERQTCLGPPPSDILCLAGGFVPPWCQCQMRAMHRLEDQACQA